MNQPYPATKRKSNLFVRSLPEIAAALYVLLYLYTGIEKLKHRFSFYKALERSDLIRSLAVPFSWGVPIVEIMIVVPLIFPRTRYISLIAATGLMAAFSIYIVVMLFTSPDIPCTCGGIIQELS